LTRPWFGLAGGLIAGSFVGLGEALFVLTAANTGEYQALLYGAVLYGGFGAALGACLGFGLALIGLVWRTLPDALAWTLSALGVALMLGLWVTDRVADRLVYLGGGVPLGGHLVMIGVFAALSLLGLWLGPIFLTRTPLKVMLRPKGTAAAWASMVGLAALFSFAPKEGPGDGVMVPDRPRAELQGPDVVLIVVDSLRADHVGQGGPDGSLSPNIDRLAQDALRFEAAYSPATSTRAAFASLFTSLLPSGHGCMSTEAGLPDSVDTLAEVLREAGYATGGLPNHADLTRAFNLQQGFDYFSFQNPDYPLWATESAAQLSLYARWSGPFRRWIGDDEDRVNEHYQPADVVLERARGYVSANRAAGNRYLLVVHLMEPHAPNLGAEGAEGAGPSAPPAWAPLPDSDAAAAGRARYAAEVRVVDREVGAFVGWLQAEGAYEDTLLVLTADHGEELGDHGGWGHGDTLYDEQVHVPLLLKLPGQRFGGVGVPWSVRLIDLAPTLVGVAGAPAPPSWQGESLLSEEQLQAIEAWNAASRGELSTTLDLDLLSRTAVAEQGAEGQALASIRRLGWTYIQAGEANPRGLRAVELYDRSLDPLERRDLTGRKSEEQAELSGLLRLELQRSRSALDPGGPEGSACEACELQAAQGLAVDCAAACATP
jgi:arylsulfatase A-like enzyme